MPRNTQRGRQPEPKTAAATDRADPVQQKGRGRTLASHADSLHTSQRSSALFRVPSTVQVRATETRIQNVVPRNLLVAIGNTLRRDDGVAARVVQLLPAYASLCVLQLTPELASEIAPAAAVVFVDADSTPGEVRLERVAETSEPSRLSHDLSPGALLKIARQLYGFTGEGWLCRIPVREFGIGDGLSEEAEEAARAAADLLSRTFAF